MRLNRRHVLAGLSTLAGAALAPLGARAQDAGLTQDDIDYARIYGPVEGDRFPIPAINTGRLRPRFLRQVVDYDASLPAGTIVIDPADHFLYLTDGNGGALRYGVGVGRQGFAWAGTAQIQAKREWPDWYPPKEMMARDASIAARMSKLQSGIGMAGGPGNPLGARAMYLFQNNKDTLYRIHGTVEPYSIGTSISSGCIRMINQDVLDLYDRVAIGTTVQVLGNARQNPTGPVSRYPVPDADDGQGYAVPYDPYQ